MTETMIDFEPVTGRVAALLEGITDEQLSGPTPCEDYTLAALVNHVIGLCAAFTNAAEKRRGEGNDGPPPVPKEIVDPQWRTLLPRRLAGLAEAWRNPTAWEGESMAGGVTMPGEIMGLVALNEVAIHGWDLARASGQDYDLEPDIVAALLAFDGQDADDQAAREGIYGPLVPVADGAAPLDRLIGITGRDPNWRPSGS